ncbi:flagellar hook-basal body complex protein FliE [Undibacterium sp. TJN19]|uniref:flagellar hook-basal body complex protein FliE n=1 Tax=Undibacterium sp. TJN19 TaxID=3413055 RepID=UPI003BF284D4
MSIDAINSISAFIPAISMPELSAGTAPMAAPTAQFSSWFTEQLSQVNDQLLTADKGVQQLAAGDASNLHQVMINLEQAKLSMQLVMQVRNHLLDAYHELLQMQV